jgi:DNA-binding MurR/RpiR family transcriptional regulator
MTMGSQAQDRSMITPGDRIEDGSVVAGPDLLSQIGRSSPTMSRGERRVAELVRSDPGFAVHSHTKDIAARAGVSTATVSRFCRSVGCSGLRELKLELAKLLAVGDRYLRPWLIPTQNGTAVKEIVSLIHSSLDALVEQISEEALRRAASAIAGAARVLIFGGGGGSSMAAMEAENRLFRLGVRASYCNDSQLQLMMAAALRPDDVLIVLSITGRYEPILRAAEVANQYEGHTIAVTDPHSPLARIANEVVSFHIVEPTNILSPTPARYVLLALIDMLAYEVAQIRGDPAVESMRRIKYHLVHTRDDDDSKPLGD